MLNVKSVSASATFPIPALGNCRDASECKLYCDIPENTPSCWSYDKYILNQNVLGDETANITYPIADLGNCVTAQECFIYCNQPANQPTCLSYARKSGLVKEEEDTSVNEQELVESAKAELGCTSKDTCMVHCSDPSNMDKCRSFAQKHGLEKGENRPSPEMMIKAKNEMGCDSESSCMNFCQKPENQTKCFEFAKKNGLMKEEDSRHLEEKMEQKKRMMEAAKTELGCESFESCEKICADPANRDKCMNMGRKFGMIKDEIKPMGNNNNQKPPMPCTSEAECKKYCQSHPDECPGFSSKSNSFGSVNSSKEDFSKQRINTNSNLNSNTTPQLNPMNNQKGDFLGPSGCKTEDECKAFCEKHPDECPGFPKKPDQTNVNPTAMPEGSENRTSGKTNEKNKPPMMKKQNTNTQDYQNEVPNKAPNFAGNSQPPPNQYMNPPQVNSNQNNPPPNPSEVPR